MLAPHVTRVRRRRLWLAFGAVIAIQVASTLLLLGRGDPPAHSTMIAPQLTVVEAPPPPPPAPAPPPPPDPVGPTVARSSCPPERRDAPVLAPPELPEQVSSVRPAPSNAGWILAWNTQHVFASYDAGATFAQVLDGEGDVRDASFDCWGHAIVLRGTHVGVRDGSQEQWREVSALRDHEQDPAVVLGGGPDVAVVALAKGDTWQVRLASSRDLGASWSYRDLGPDVELPVGLTGSQDEDGTIHTAFAIPDCMSEELYASTIKDGVVATHTQGLGDGVSFAAYRGLVATNWQWFAKDGKVHDLERPAGLDGARIVPGAFPVFVAGDKTYRFKDGKLRALPLVVEGEPEAVDLAGRVWSIACGRMLIATRKATGFPATCDCDCC